MIWRCLISAYRAGYDEITVLFQNPKSNKNLYTGFGYDNLQFLFTEGDFQLSPIETIQALVNRLIGIEIIEQHENRCVIREMGETNDKQFDNSLRRIFFLLISMMDEIYDAYSKGNREPLRSIHLIDTNIDRFEDFCFRVLNKKGYKDTKKAPIMHNIIFQLELVGDEYKKMALHFLDMEGKPTDLMLKAFDFQRSQFRRFYNLFYSYSKEKAAEIYTFDRKGDEFLRKNYVNFTDDEKEIIHHFKKAGIHALSLTELRIDLEA
jgi:hypothetical protein